jgi:hypothetical protein
MHPITASDAAATTALLARCGANLQAIQIAMLPTSSAASNSGGGGGGPSELDVRP